MRRTLVSGFLDSLERFPDRPALEVQGTTFTYDELNQRASSIAAVLDSLGPSNGTRMTAVLASRSPTAYHGILGALMVGNAYVPINPASPPVRSAAMLESASCETIIVGPEAIKPLRQILEIIDAPMTVLMPAINDVLQLRDDFPSHSFLPASDFVEVAPRQSGSVDPNDIAYLLFTSGSTGDPKGVPIQHQSICHFIASVVDRYNFSEQDRFSQMFDLVFDLSIFDLFVAWDCGACVVCPDPMHLEFPGRFILDSGITVWFSVPFVALSMLNFRMLEAGMYPDLRVSLFCGEALREDAAVAWFRAAPNSRLENLYGPTELTLACTAYQWEPDSSPADCDHGIVPIGSPLPGLEAIVVDDDMIEVKPGEIGELLMSGPQVAPGYWRDKKRSAAAFITPPGKRSIHYRTGDLVRRPSANAPLKYIGRVDNQIKIRGNRVELGEIEAVLREIARVDLAIAIGWPRTAAGADSIVAFLHSETPLEIDEIRCVLSDRLPNYMVPNKLYVIDDVPLNANGKVDRGALTKSLEIDS